jgi:hypothetical protein
LPLETASYPTDLVTSNPAASDGMNNADDHMRLIKAVIKNALGGVNSALTRVIGSTFGVLVGDGTITAPGMAFTSDPSIGFYRPSSGTIAVSGQLRGIGACPPGAIMDFAMASPPVGWFPCDGSSLSTAAWPDLFAAIGYTWGGSGANFNVPNFISRYRRHRDNGVTGRCCRKHSKRQHSGPHAHRLRVGVWNGCCGWWSRPHRERHRPGAQPHRQRDPRHSNEQRRRPSRGASVERWKQRYGHDRYGLHRHQRKHRCCWLITRTRCPLPARSLSTQLSGTRRGRTAQPC